MHDTCEHNLIRLKDCYVSKLGDPKDITIVEIGSQIVDPGPGKVRTIFEGYNFIGLDIEEHRGVDIVLSDPYTYPLEDNSVDVVVSSSCYEHVELFWLSYLESIRILKPTGLFYMNAPSNGHYHGYPTDCWRFYGDAGIALETWAHRSNYVETVLLESYICHPKTDLWYDNVVIHLKDKAFIDKFPNRIIDTFREMSCSVVNRGNGLSYERNGF